MHGFFSMLRLPGHKAGLGIVADFLSQLE
jgi:hypothetical protein